MSLLPFGFVAIKENVYLTIAKAVLTNANPYKMEKTEFKETYGFLGGRVVVGNCKLNDVLVSHVGTHDEVKLEAKHYITAAEWDSQKLYIKEPKEFLVGWWHSHFIGHTFSGIDVINHLGWQNANNPHGIGLVFDPSLISEKNPGFVILKLENYNKGEASEVQSIDYVIQMKEKYRENYIECLKEKLPQFF